MHSFFFFNYFIFFLTLILVSLIMPIQPIMPIRPIRPIGLTVLIHLTLSLIHPQKLFHNGTFFANWQRCNSTGSSSQVRLRPISRLMLPLGIGHCATSGPLAQGPESQNMPLVYYITHIPQCFARILSFTDVRVFILAALGAVERIGGSP